MIFVIISICVMLLDVLKNKLKKNYSLKILPKLLKKIDNFKLYRFEDYLVKEEFLLSEIVSEYKVQLYGARNFIKFKNNKYITDLCYSKVTSSTKRTIFNGVMIKNTLDKKLDLNKFKIISKSNRPKKKYIYKNILMILNMIGISLYFVFEELSLIILFSFTWFFLEEFFITSDSVEVGSEYHHMKNNIYTTNSIKSKIIENIDDTILNKIEKFTEKECIEVGITIKKDTIYCMFFDDYSILGDNFVLFSEKKRRKKWDKFLKCLELNNLVVNNLISKN